MLSPASRVSRTSRGSTASSTSYNTHSFHPSPAISRQNTRSSQNDGRSARQSKRMSVTALYLSMSSKDKEDLEISDELARGTLVGQDPKAKLLLTHHTYSPAQRTLRELKSKISMQSKKNFVLEKDVRYLDSRIALLIQNRMALEEVRTFPCLT